MARPVCDFCPRIPTELIRIARRWYKACTGCADRTPHRDRTVLRNAHPDRQLARLGR